MKRQVTMGALLREVARLHTHLQRTNVACCAGTTVTQCTVLTELGRSGSVPLAELSRLIGFDKSWTSRAVEHLVQEGLIEKVPSQSDHRMVRLSLTTVGEQRLRDLNQTLGGLSERVMERIPLSEHEGVQRALTLLLAALQAEDEACADERSTSLCLIERASPADLAAILALLERCGLPQAGLEEILPTTVVARESVRVVGCSALEVYGTTALLRSVAVDPIRRSHGLRSRLVQAALSLAQQLGIHEVYLLTETAADYFPRFGFHRIERAAASPAIHRSVEWTSVCPASAQAMVLRLQAGERLYTS